MSTGEVVGAYRPGGSRGEGSEGCDTGPEHGTRGLEQPGGGAAEPRQFTSSRLLPYSTRAGVQLPHSTLHYHPTRTLTSHHIHNHFMFHVVSNIAPKRCRSCDQNTWTLQIIRCKDWTHFLITSLQDVVLLHSAAFSCFSGTTFCKIPVNSSRSFNNDCEIISMSLFSFIFRISTGPVAQTFEDLM